MSMKRNGNKHLSFLSRLVAGITGMWKRIFRQDAEEHPSPPAGDSEMGPMSLLGSNGNLDVLDVPLKILQFTMMSRSIQLSTEPSPRWIFSPWTKLMTTRELNRPRIIGFIAETTNPTRISEKRLHLLPDGNVTNDTCNLPPYFCRIEYVHIETWAC